MGVFRRIINKPRTFALRGWLFQIHLYTGLLAGLYAIVIAVTGSALVFQTQMRDWIDRDLTRVTGSGPHVSADQVLLSVRKAYPDFPVMNIRMPATERSTFRVSAVPTGGGHEIYVNPFNASIVGEGYYPGTGSRKIDFLAWLQRLHFNLLSGKTGRIVNGVGGLMMLLLSVTGLVIWWPGKALAKRAMSINWRANWKRVNYDLHSFTGFFLLLFTVIISMTGAYYAWPAESKKLVGWFSPLRQLDEATRTSEDPGRHLDKGPKAPKHLAGQLPVGQLMETARQMVPGAWVSMVMLSYQPGQAAKITLMNGGAREYQNSNYVYLDPYTGSVLRVDSVENRSVGDAILAWVTPLHFGTFGGGITVYVLWIVLGLSPAVLGVSGILMWWNRVAVKKVNKLRRALDTKPETIGAG
jgi:uncharacterized iron-regulated membrane protein